eukprot:scaffold50664_cov31-Tisochrysis_lutea.AAC.2
MQALAAGARADSRSLRTHAVRRGLGGESLQQMCAASHGANASGANPGGASAPDAILLEPRSHTLIPGFGGHSRERSTVALHLGFGKSLQADGRRAARSDATAVGITIGHDRSPPHCVPVLYCT